MMKATKTLIALLLTFALVMALAVTASAASGDPMGHDYVAYQVFKGNATATATETTLTDVEWGSNIPPSDNVKYTQFLAEVKALFPSLASLTTVTAKDVAKQLNGKDNDSEEAIKFARIVYKYKVGTGVTVSNSDSSNLTQDGYYLIVDNGPLGSLDDATNMALLQLAKDQSFVISQKTTVPEVVKKLKDKNDSQPVTENWRDSADYDIGDLVPYQITFTVDGTKLQYFDNYSLELSDTLDASLTLDGVPTLTCNGENVAVTWNPTNNQNPVNEGTTSDHAIRVTLKNIKDTTSIPSTVLNTNGDNTFVLSFNAKLNDAAVIGCNAQTGKGNDNTVNLQYSQNPNRNDYVGSNGTYFPTTEPKPNNPNQTGTDFGKTPDDVVRVFTYQLVIQKVDQNNQPLTGAEFQLFKYNAASTATNEEDKYEAVGAEKAGSGTPANTYTWTGLDDGMYKLVETKNPDGYNKINDSYFTISAEHTDGTNDPRLTSLTETTTTGKNCYITFIDNDAQTTITDGNIATGTFEGKVTNEPGVVLPETGDEGTQMLYIVGSTLLLGALVLIVTKKRVGEQA